MKALKLAGVFAALAIVAGALAGAASVVRSIPGAAVDDPAGIAYTEDLELGRYWRKNDSNGLAHETSNRVNGSIHVNVRGAADKLGMTAGTWAARLSCPSPVEKMDTETFDRSGLALSASTSFALSMATPRTAGLIDEALRCWLRVTISLPEDGETITIRDAMLPVRVVRAQRAT